MNKTDERKAIMLGVKITPEMRKQLQAVAEREERCLSDVVRRMLKSELHSATA